MNTNTQHEKSHGYFLILAGGTGGHVNAGIALAQEIFKHNLNVMILSDSCNVDQTNLQTVEEKIPIFFHSPPQRPTGLISIFQFLPKLLKSFIIIRNLDKTYNVHTTIGMGGYASFPGLLYGLLFRKIIYLCEQNTVPGLVNRIFYRTAKYVFASFPIIKYKSMTAGKKLKITGMPIRREILSIKKSKSLKMNRPKRILITGGSLGSQLINNTVCKLINSDAQFASKYSIVLITGKMNYKSTLEQIGNIDKSIQAESYIDRMETLLQKTDLIISQAGSGTITEALCCEIPMILIPLTLSASNHQFYNAQYINSLGAAEVIEEHMLDANNLKTTIMNFLETKTYLQYQKAAQKIRKLNAGNNIMQYLIEGLNLQK